ncbi:unnamed protein product [Cyprideis torosa]|uniref:Serine/threonine-protein phosphatase 4 regulatory subunit 3-like central domain-containing protein n=1 Tax=Cyprideis torosa TaxID=163714 RepID=A0A7R8ZNI8_9CRUS|nr:unnamed protein product [Cyprideis torosa]CAG0886456.1 unnamed protein product [Cyprideis torosa]
MVSASQSSASANVQSGAGKDASGSMTNTAKQMTVLEGKGGGGAGNASSVSGNMMNRKTIENNTRRRVKLYALNQEKQWDDKGTGYVSYCYLEKHRGLSLVVTAETDGGTLLESKIQADTAYQKQQETLIVWSEGENYDLALSFQEKVGCDEIWEKICQIQGKDPSVEITQDIVEESEDERYEEPADINSSTVELPPVDVMRLEEISEVVVSCMSSAAKRDKLALLIESENYIPKLLNVFNMCEDVEDIDGLHHLYSIFKNLFLLNRNALNEVMFTDEYIFDVVGCLEYDPAYREPRPHREYLRNKTNFHEVIPIQSPDLLSKIHQTYRVQYIQDVILPTPSVFEENMSALSSFIFFNKMEVVHMIQEDEKYLQTLFSQLMDERTDDTRRRDLMLFLKELCSFSQTLQPQGRESFLKVVSNLGVLPALEMCLCSEDPAVKAASTEVLRIVVEFSPSMVREFMLSQVNKPEARQEEQDQLFTNVIIEQIICDPDPELSGAVALVEIMKNLLDPENMLAGGCKSEKADFLTFFYKHSMHELVAPILANTCNDTPGREDYQTVQLLSSLLELLSFCVDHHTHHIKNYMLSRDLLKRILVLLKSQHVFLALCCLRLMRKILGMKDEFYERHIVRGNLFAPVVECLIRNKGRYNMLDSAILELFEFIRQEDITSLISHVVETHGKTLDEIGYVNTFRDLRSRYDAIQRERTESLPSLLRSSCGKAMQPSRFRRDPRDLDEDEEIWFESEDTAIGMDSGASTDKDNGDSSSSSSSSSSSNTDVASENHTVPSGDAAARSSPTESEPSGGKVDCTTPPRPERPPSSESIPNSGATEENKKVEVNSSFLCGKSKASLSP